MIQYLYKLTYPENPADPIEDRETSLKLTNAIDQISSGPFTNYIDEVTLGAIDTDAMYGVTAIDEEENRAAQDSTDAKPVADVDQSVATRELLLSSLDQDLQVYVLADK